MIKMALLVVGPLLSASGSFTPTGEILYSRGNSAAFDAVTVLGPSVSMRRRDDGSWGGTLFNRAVDLTVRPSGFSGLNTQISIRAQSDRTVMEGMWAGHFVHYEVQALQGGKVRVTTDTTAGAQANTSMPFCSATIASTPIQGERSESFRVLDPTMLAIHGRILVAL